MSTELVREGDVIAARYRVERVLGMGGMGLVVAARHLGLDELVAIKVLLPEVIQDGEAVARFEREARAAIKIKSEHVARVMDCGALDNGTPFMVMEHLEGRDLEAVLAERRRLPVEEAASFALQACEAMAAAHAVGIIHRDLKPANLFLTRGPDGADVIKVLDFGISKIEGASSGKANIRTHAVIGTPLYMSPEQMVSSGNVDARTDIWSIGAILYEMLGARPPFAGQELAQVCAAVMNSSPTPLRQLRPDVPDGLETLVLQCLEKDRDRRPANVAELATAIAPFAPLAVRGLAMRAARVLHAAGLSLPPSELVDSLHPGAMAVTCQPKAGAIPSAPAVRRMPLRLLVVAGIAGVAMIAASTWWMRTHRPAPTAVDSAPEPTGGAQSSSAAIPSRAGVETIPEPASSPTSPSAGLAPGPGQRVSPRSSGTASPPASTAAPAASADLGKRGLDLFNDTR